MWNIVLPTVLRMSFTGSIVILVILLARLLLRRAPKIFSYLLWGVVLLRLLCPISFPAQLSVMQFVDFLVGTEEQAGNAANDKTPDLKSTITSGFQELVQQQDIPPQTSHAKVVGYTQKPAINSQSSAENPMKTFLYLGTVIWLVGAVSIFTYSIISLLRFRRKLVGAVRLKDNIYLTDYISSAFVLGLLKPRIYLPTTLSETELEYIILHEQVHIHRKDYLVKMLSLITLAIHWFNPLVWLAFHLSEKDMEMSCDEAVMKKMDRDIRAEYSASLLKLATGKRVLSGTLPAFGEGETGNRIKHILRYKKPTIAVIVAAAAIMTTTVVFAGSEPKKDDDKSNAYSNEYYSFLLPANCTIQENASDVCIMLDNEKIAMITIVKDFQYNNTVKSIVANWIGMKATIKSESSLLTDKKDTFHKAIVAIELSAAEEIKGEAPKPDEIHYFYLTEGKFFIDILVYDTEYSTLMESAIKSFTLKETTTIKETLEKSNGIDGNSSTDNNSTQDNSNQGNNTQNAADDQAHNPQDDDDGQVHNSQDNDDGQAHNPQDNDDGQSHDAQDNGNDDDEGYDAEAIRKAIPNFEKYAHSVPPVEFKEGQSWMEALGIDKNYESTMECAYLRSMSEDTIEVDPAEFITKDSDPKRRKELGVTLKYLHEMDGYYLNNPDTDTLTWKIDENTEFIFLDWGRDFINVDNFPGMTIKTKDRELFQCYIATYKNSMPGMPFFFEVENGVVKRVVERFFA